MHLLRGSAARSHPGNAPLILIVNCSKQKSLFRGPARDVYIGPIVQLSLKYASIKGWTPFILSGKHGIISPDFILDPYEEWNPGYDGAWPDEKGFWVGSLEYFVNAPPHIHRLLPRAWSYGQQKSFLNRFVNPHLYGGNAI
jgi:hypothetical protein